MKVEIKAVPGGTDVFVDGERITDATSIVITLSAGVPLPRVEIKRLCTEVKFMAENADVITIKEGIRRAYKR